jgi:hypothetical protein
VVYLVGLVVAELSMVEVGRVSKVKEIMVALETLVTTMGVVAVAEQGQLGVLFAIVRAGKEARGPQVLYLVL